MDLKWWIASVIVPVVCVIIGGIFGYLACTVRIKYKNKDSHNKKEVTKTKVGDVGRDSYVNSNKK